MEIFKLYRQYTNDENSNCKIIGFFNNYIERHNDTLYLDFSDVEFISANLFALFGACIYTLYKKNGLHIKVYGMSDKLKKVIQKNGFCRHFSLSQINDSYKTTIEYRIFNASTDALVEFEKYLLINLFSNSKLPTMTEELENQIIDNLLEMFNNVIDHTEAREVFVCGQVFPNKGKLFFSIVDIGTTIKENVEAFATHCGKAMPSHCIKWAVVGGNTTMIGNAPGGMGLTILSEFILKNNGTITIISDNEYYEFSAGSVTYKTIADRFIGTVVTICINLNDRSVYLVDDSNSLISF